MKKVCECVLRLHTQLMQQQGINQQFSDELEIRQKNGIVSLLLDLEDELNVRLDKYLPEIRVCKTIGNFINIIEKACSGV